ncbi:toxin CcdB [Roseovarius sp. MBR-154]|jgi:toxin CcdB
MAQGRIHQLRGGGELVCRVQSDLGLETPYILCAPVVPQAGWGALVPRLHIPFALEGVAHVILMSQLVALPGSEIGMVVGDAFPLRDEIIAAVDLLVSGF